MPRRSPAFEGNPKAKICLIGEAPSREEMKRGYPFCGPAGEVLDECLYTAGIGREEVYITNVFDEPVAKDKATGKIVRGKEVLWTQHQGLTEAGRAASAGCVERLREGSPSVLVPLGNTALSLVMPSLREGRETWVGQISRWRGSILETADGRKAIATYHPANILYGATHNQHIIATDLKRAKEQSSFPEVRRRPRALHINPTFDECMGWLEDLHRAGSRVWWDVEIYNGQLSAISLTNHAAWAISIPFLHGPGQHSWSEGKEAALIKAIAAILEDPLIPMGNQNIAFDMWVMAHIYGIKVRGQLADPMILHHIVFPDFPKSIAFQCSHLTDQPYYKDDGGKNLWRNPWGNLEKFWRYSALDACIACECFEALEAQHLQEDSPYAKTYHETLELIEPVVFMELRGTRVDEAGIQREREEAVRKAAAALAFCREHGLDNPASPKQCGEYFWGDGKHVSDKFALLRVARAGGPKAEVARQVLIARQASKRAGTEFDTVFRNGRFHCSYNIRGTNTGRLSSSETVLGDGGNAQNKTTDFLTHLIPD